MDCSYCILQAYFNQPFIRLFVNTEEIFLKLKTFVDTHPEEIIRLGTGEFTDSLALDHLTGFSDTPVTGIVFLSPMCWLS